MLTTIPSKTALTFENFLAQYGDEARYELIDGALIDLEPTGPHEKVAAFISRKLNFQIESLDLPLFIPHRCLIKLLGTDVAFRPDVIVLDERNLSQEPLWAKEPVITLSQSIPLVVEVVSTNWQNDYARKAEDYSLLGIPELWLVDYLGLGGRDYIGSPKQPTLSHYLLEPGTTRYRRQLLRGGDPIASPTFPHLQLTVDQIFRSSGIQ
ncbi:MAG: Uma2 family endonuclease [Alkalinema sp. RU_4_3]|nr:Uma2 family endonuclease [Alkalinema sp. RU_4_3]